MKHITIFLICILGFLQNAFMQEIKNDYFPDGKKIPTWFLKTTKIELNDLNKKFTITDYGAIDDSLMVQTSAIQNTINEAAKQGGGVIIIPKGVFLSGALYFKPKTHLYVSEGAVLKGSDNIVDYPIKPSRMEGQSLNYFSALINAYGVDGFTISGKGTIDGNGHNYWKAFWKRRKENSQCTNLEVSRPRLVFIWNCNNVQIQDVRLINSGFWTNHFYKCKNVKMIDLYIFSPKSPVEAPSTDGIDIDVCTNFLIKGCYISVNDNAIALKGGKGPLAGKDTCNGANINIIIEDSEFGFCHSALTCGSESIHNKNILMRNCRVKGANRLLWLKMRPDTQQKYEFITVENIKGQAHSLLYIKPWNQFFDLKGQKNVPTSLCKNISLKNIDLKCEVFYDVETPKNYQLIDFSFKNLNIETKNVSFDKNLIKGITTKDVIINNHLLR